MKSYLNIKMGKSNLGPYLKVVGLDQYTSLNFYFFWPGPWLGFVIAGLHHPINARFFIFKDRKSFSLQHPIRLIIAYYLVMCLFNTYPYLTPHIRGKPHFYMHQVVGPSKRSNHRGKLNKPSSPQCVSLSSASQLLLIFSKSFQIEI